MKKETSPQKNEIESNKKEGGLKRQLSKTTSQDKWREFSYDRAKGLEDFAPSQTIEEIKLLGKNGKNFPQSNKSMKPPPAILQKSALALEKYHSSTVTPSEL